MKRAPVKEQDVAAVVVTWLESLGADVYQEVEVSGGVADIVAIVHAETWIVEVKSSLSLALITQAMERRRLAHRVYVAAPYLRRSAGREICGDIGIGVLEVHVGSECVDSGNGFGRSSIRVLADSRRWNSRPVELRQQLRPEHKTHAKAGAIGAGGRWTEFRSTTEQLARIVRDEPGITLKAAVDKIRHHYASSRSALTSLTHWVDKGKVAGVRLERTGRALTLHPEAG